MKWRKHTYWFLLLLLLSASCARISTPTGGPKDTIPPVLVSSHPALQQTNFKGNVLELEFSEAIVLNNPKEQLIITPSVGKDFTVEARKTKVVLTVEQPLEDSTTYTFNFREAVQDITEKNPARNLKVAFSTGDYIDSLSVSGTVFNITDQSPANNATVAIQAYIDTFSIFKHPAVYFTKTDKQGTFKLENLKPGLYHLYAINDQNKNLIADPKNESYGFKRDSFLLDNNITNASIGLLRLDVRPLKITSARPYNTYYNIRVSKNIKSYRITAEDSVYSAFGADRSNVLVYNTFPGRDSIAIRAILTDSIDNQIDTTLYAKFSQAKLTPEKFNVTLESSTLYADRGILTAAFRFTKPLSQINFDSLFFQVDSVNRITIDHNSIIYAPDEKTLRVLKAFDPKLYERPPIQPGTLGPRAKPQSDKTSGSVQKTTPKNILTIGKGTFISIELDSSRALTREVSPVRVEDLGVILAEAQPGPEKKIIQLVDRSKKVIKEAIHKDKATFDDLSPGDYQLRIILDRNGNGKWDPGNYLRKEEPEHIIYWRDEKGLKDIKLKANFEQGPLLITY